MSSQKKHFSGNKVSKKILNKEQQYQSDSLTNKKTEKVEKLRCKSGVGKPIAGKLKTNNNERQINTLLKENYSLLKQENQALSHQLRRKARKIEEMKETIKTCQTRLACYEQMIGLLKNKGESSTEAEDTLSASRKTIQEMIREAQDIAKTSIDKYKKIEKEINHQRKNLQQQILQLKEENKKLKEQLQNTSSFSTNRKRNHSNSYFQQQTDKDKQLKALQNKELEWIKKEESLRSMLAEIGNKVESYQRMCRATEEKAKIYKIEIDSWKDKYQAKCRKSKENNLKWRSLFGDLMKQTVETKKEIEAVKKMLQRLIKKEARQLSQQ